MREIKFRVWDKCELYWLEYKRWAVGWHLPLDQEPRMAYMWVYLSHNGDAFNELDWCLEHPDDFAVCQFTGLLDRNGREIYEGDIVRYMADNEEVYQAVIGFEMGEESIFFSGFTGQNPKKVTDDFLDDDGQFKDLDETFELEVIGNIYENPELLEVGNNGR